MTDDVETENQGQTSSQSDELNYLKSRATLIGVQYSNNIGVETLRERIRAKLEADEEKMASAGFNPLSGMDAETQAKGPLSLHDYLIAEQMKLVRLRITNMDPKKKDLHGEIITVANEYIGTVRKFIPFGEATDNGYHVPYCLYDLLKNREFLNVRTRTVNGQIRVEKGWAKEFALEVLEPLTQEDLDRLAASQAAGGTVGTDRD